MSLLYSKLRLQIPQVSDGKNAIITSPRGVNRSVPMTYPLTDVFVAGMDKYTVQAGTGSESFSVGNGKLKKIVTEDASAITVATMPTKTTYLVGENLDLTGTVINATIQKGDGTSETRDVTSQCDFSPANGTQLNTQGSQRIDVDFGSLSSFFNVNVTIRNILKKLPINFYQGSAVIYNNEIHILGGYNSGTKHYKWDGTSWVLVSTLPYSFYRGSAVVYNNEIHILGSYDYKTRHYKWNGSSWSSVSTLPYNFYEGSIVVYNNEIHILGGNGVYTSYYKWDGSSWSSVSTLPYNSYDSSAVVYNNEIHLLGGGGTGYGTNHYKWDGSSWSSVSTLPYDFSHSCAVIWNSGAENEIIILGSEKSAYYNYDAQWDGSTWTVGTD